MPKFNVTITLNLTTEVEPEGVRFSEPYGSTVEDYEDNSYWYRSDVTSDGGQINFVVEAEDEQAAEAIAIEIVSDGNEVEDDLGFTWLATDVEYNIEKVEIPMDFDRANDLVKAYLDQMEGMDEELKEAFGFILDQLFILREALASRDRTIRELRGEIDRLQNGPDGSEAPAEVVA